MPVPFVRMKNFAIRCAIRRTYVSLIDAVLLGLSTILL